MLYSTAIKARQARMRLLGLFLLSQLTLVAQVELVDPEYVIPKENPYTAASDLTRGEQLFKGQCAGCHGPKGEGGKGAVLAQPRLRRAPDEQSFRSGESQGTARPRGR